MIARLLRKEMFGECDTLYTFECSDIASKAKPGQFVEVRVTEGMEPFLRRPISIFDATENELKLLVRTAGRGTDLMTMWDVGREVDILGPLGNGFMLKEKDKEVLLVGGGIGAAPLYFLSEKLLQQQKRVNFLFLPKRDEIVLESFQNLKENIEIIFSENRHTLSEVLENIFTEHPDIAVIYTCGPTGMMKAVTEKAMEKQIPVQVSLEERMGCGIGICVGCAVPIKTDDGDFRYKKVCSDGPVFMGEEVMFQ